MIASALATTCRLITGAVAQWHCDPQADTPRIYYGNHSSHLDFIVIWSALPPRLRRLARPVAGADYWNCGVVRRYLATRVFRAVLIERAPSGARATPAQTRVSFDRLTAAMTGGGSLIVFPEGTRSLNGEIGTFKSGLFHLARARPDAEIVPVYLENLNRILPKGEALPVPMLSRVVFGVPVETAGANEDKALFLGRAREALLRMRPGV
jgi:1-acyl-sn-glycerol-3-phosphate acyltransferase